MSETIVEIMSTLITYVVGCLVICFMLFVDGDKRGLIRDCVTLKVIAPETRQLNSLEKYIFKNRIIDAKWKISMSPNNKTLRTFSVSEGNLYFYLTVQNDTLIVSTFLNDTVDSSVNFILKKSFRDGLLKLIHADTSRVICLNGTTRNEENACVLISK